MVSGPNPTPQQELSEDRVCVGRPLPVFVPSSHLLVSLDCTLASGPIHSSVSVRACMYLCIAYSCVCIYICVCVHIHTFVCVCVCVFVSCLVETQILDIKEFAAEVLRRGENSVQNSLLTVCAVACLCFLHTLHCLHFHPSCSLVRGRSCLGCCMSVRICDMPFIHLFPIPIPTSCVWVCAFSRCVREIPMICHSTGVCVSLSIYICVCVCVCVCVVEFHRSKAAIFRV